MKRLILPCIRGIIGDWTYYSTVMKIKDIVENHRIITVAESPDLYTKNINDVLQREINPTRINQISKYLTTNNERFFSSLTVAIHKGNPQWFDINLGSHFQVENEDLNEDELDFIENKFGILSLSGEEQIFALDGQHRLVGLREAIKTRPELGEEEIALIYVVHDIEKKERTRRLFTVLNKYAEKPKGAELIILDEDDSAAINTRRLVENHPIFKLENSISASKNGNLTSRDLKSFTTLVTLNNINKILYSRKNDFYTRRPLENELTEMYEVTSKFWDFLFENFPEILQFIEGSRGIDLNGVFERNAQTGGSLLLRPVGQELIAKIYKLFLDKNELDKLKSKIRSVNFNLSGNLFRYIYWNNGKMLGKEEQFKIKLLSYVLGIYSHGTHIEKELKRVYKNFNVDYVVNSIKPIEVE
jgi:DNA sulfur modification protein DndB